jgi:hypothetical protein
MQLDDEIVLRFRLGCVLVAGVDRMKPKAKAQVKISQGSRKKDQRKAQGQNQAKTTSCGRWRLLGGEEKGTWK